MRDTGEEERKESEKIKDRRMIILEEEDNKSYLLNPKEEKTRVNLSSLNNSTCYTNYDQNILTITEEPYSYAI